MVWSPWATSCFVSLWKEKNIQVGLMKEHLTFKLMLMQRIWLCGTQGTLFQFPSHSLESSDLMERLTCELKPSSFFWHQKCRNSTSARSKFGWCDRNTAPSFFYLQHHLITEWAISQVGAVPAKWTTTGQRCQLQFLSENTMFTYTPHHLYSSIQMALHGDKERMLFLKTYFYIIQIWKV